MAETDNGERLAYQIIVSDPGTRNQNWHGILYDSNGSPLLLEPGKTVKTGIGEFVSVAQQTPGAPYGMIHADMVRFMKTGNGNVIIDGEPWSYQLFVAGEGSRSELWRGQLLHAGGIVPAGGEAVDTPMGPYIWRGENPVKSLWAGPACAGKRGFGLVLAVLFGRPQGWFHVSWSLDKAHAPASIAARSA